MKKRKFLRFCTTSGQPCYTSGSFAFSTWPHGRDVLICERCVVIFLKTVTFNFIQTFIANLPVIRYLYWNMPNL